MFFTIETVAIKDAGGLEVYPPTGQCLKWYSKLSCLSGSQEDVYKRQYQNPLINLSLTVK